MCVFSWISRFFVVAHTKLVRNCGSGISQLITLLHEAMTYDVLVKMKLNSINNFQDADYFSRLHSTFMLLMLLLFQLMAFRSTF